MDTNVLLLGDCGHSGPGKTTLLSGMIDYPVEKIEEWEQRSEQADEQILSNHFSSPHATYVLWDFGGFSSMKRALITGTAGAECAILVVSLPDGFHQQRLMKMAFESGIRKLIIFMTKCEQADAADAAEITAMNLRNDLKTIGFDGDGVRIVWNSEAPGSAGYKRSIAELTAAMDAVFAANAEAPAPSPAAEGSASAVFTAYVYSEAVLGTGQDKGLPAGKPLDFHFDSDKVCGTLKFNENIGNELTAGDFAEAEVLLDHPVCLCKGMRFGIETGKHYVGDGIVL